MADFEKSFRQLAEFSNSANTSCKDFTSVLIDLGFEIVDCGSAGHKIATHPAIELQNYPDYDCGHSEGNHVKRPYIKKLCRFVKEHKEVIKEYLE